MAIVKWRLCLRDVAGHSRSLPLGERGDDVRDAGFAPEAEPQVRPRTPLSTSPFPFRGEWGGEGFHTDPQDGGRRLGGSWVTGVRGFSGQFQRGSKGGNVPAELSRWKGEAWRKALSVVLCVPWSGREAQTRGVAETSGRQPASRCGDPVWLRVRAREASPNRQSTCVSEPKGGRDLVHLMHGGGMCI